MDQFFGFAQELLQKGRAQVADPYAAAELYDLLVQFQHDASFYVELAQQQGGRVLDLACGSGRLIPHLIESGLDVVGLDLSTEMLARAATKLGSYAQQVQLVAGDMRTFCFSKPFNTIIIPYCSLMYLYNDADRLAVFQRCYEHLTPGGYLAFDFLTGLVELGEGLPTLALQGIHPFTEEILISIVQIKGLASNLRLLNQINYVLPIDGTNGKVTVHSSKEAMVCPQQMGELLKKSGFSLQGVYTNHSCQEYDGGEECLIVAQK